MSATRIIDALLSLVTPVAIVACAYFGAHGVSDYIAARYVGEATAAERPVRRAPAARSSPAPRSKDGADLVARNMFCSDCETSTLEPGIAVAADTGTVPETQLPLRLVATSISTDRASSFASIVNTESSYQGAYWPGESIPGAGPVESITGRYVDFRNSATGRLERVRLDAPEAASTPSPAPQPGRVATRPARPGDAVADKIASSVRSVGNNTWEVERSVIDMLKGNPRALRGVRIMPNAENGQPAGFKVAYLSPRSPVAKIGVRRGDVISGVNGMSLTTPDKVLEVVAQLQTMNKLVVTVQRGGKNVDLTYLLR